MGKIVNGSDAQLRNGSMLDWRELADRITAALDVRAEFAALGVRFTTGTPNARGILECHALGREDAHPSAMVSVTTGVYHDSGSGESAHLFEFAVRHGAFGRWIDAVRAYGEKVGVEIPTPHYHSRGRIREATYLYHRADGAVAFAVFRYREPSGRKSFSQHPPDGKGGWKYGPGAMDGVELVPYRLPELLASDPRDTAWIVEGEKDADRLAREGVAPATCNPMGAGKWRPEFAEHLRDRACVVIPDNDAPGRRHALAVCASLKGAARSVKLLDLPGLPPKGDVSDWLDLGHTAEELGALAYACPEWEPGAEGLTETESGKGRPAHLGDLRARLTDVRWIWPGWLPAARIAGLGATEGTGKTRLMLDLARRIWNGLPWPDGHEPTFPTGTPTLWICADGNQDELAEAAGAMGLPDEAVYFNAVPEDVYGGTDLDDPDVLEMLDSFIPIIRPAFVVVDSLTYATRKDLCRANDVQVLMTPLKEIAQRHRISIIPQLHLNKEGSALGRRIRGLTRTLWLLDCPDPIGQPDRRRFWVDKSFDRKPAALGVTMAGHGNEYDAEVPDAPTRAPGRPAAARDRSQTFILDALRDRGDLRVTDLLNEFLGTGGSKNTFFRARDALVAARAVTCDGIPKVLSLLDVPVPKIPEPMGNGDLGTGDPAPCGWCGGPLGDSIFTVYRRPDGSPWDGGRICTACTADYITHRKGGT